MINTILLSILVGLVLLIILIPLLLVFRVYFHDEHQKEHSILRNYPVLGKARYFIEKMGPELRQYLFNEDNEGKPFSRKEFQQVVVAGKYNSRMIGFGSERPFQEDGFFLVNHMFPTLDEEIRVEQEPKVRTKTYQIDDEKLFSRKEHREDDQIKPYYLQEDDAIVLGNNRAKHPFHVKGVIGQSAMSYGSLGEKAITALSEGLGMAGGTWMNTGEGGLSPYHLKGNVDIIMQIGPAMFGVRTKDGDFSWEEFKDKCNTEQVKAFELKLAQGAKTRGGHLDGEKVSEEIARIRMVEEGQSIDSPNRFKGIDTPQQLLSFLQELRDVGGKPVGMKIVAGSHDEVETLVKAIKDTGIIPDFITVDGSEGGTGASYYELAEGVGLPIFSGLPLVHGLLKKYGLRDETYIIASGKLLTPEKAATALALGADMINIARGFMLSVGCIMAQVCHTNNCPVGVATTDPDLQKALSIEEKKYRVCNYLVSMREGLYYIAEAVGAQSPRGLNQSHLVYKTKESQTYTMDEWLHKV
ncbi:MULTISPECIES: FMN-binding glutamate synthase family protein [Pontibacillus]|uniref:FMN-binding glutamate synthase family protein n=1 Tax=Pontibacillus chungwhensis TaxID=265426 RepID=A0ABY8UWS4_9BACI|nr:MULTISPECIES: FMN-binding glutamate synthase family protein [Pontibacillus]MCD5323998.1 FMN-binding glutamate synthase family protein [Pontibacillus sp. HN14]WIF97939.1 FMN-binding glutamate synthase family protein [Pontibacillus chungwhensis]